MIKNLLASGFARMSAQKLQEGLPVGRVTCLTATGHPECDYFIFIPESGWRRERVFVSVHGIARNALQHALLFREQCERAQAVLMAPLFSRAHFRHYQKLGGSITGLGADVAFNAMLDDFFSRLGVRSTPVALFGFSGGGQFAHRYAMRHPGRVAKLATGAAGWYTLPDENLPYPLGMRGDNGRQFAALDDFLRIPALVLVGDLDTVRDDALNRSADIDASQGMNRLQRGRYWVTAMREAADRRGISCCFEFREMKGVDHSFEMAMNEGGMGDIVADFLFGS